MRKKNPNEILIAAYRTAVKKYLKRYGILGYYFNFCVKELEDCFASVRYDVTERRMATFNISVGTPLELVDDLAHHEVLELLLGDLATMAGHSHSEDLVNKELHRVIYTLSNLED